MGAKDILISLYTSATLEDLLREINFKKVDFKIKLNEPIENIEKEFKLSSTKTITNMHLFNAYEHLKKYDTIYEIIDDFCQVRLKTYDLRKSYLLEDITNQLHKISNKVKYIMAVLNDKIDLRRKQTHCSWLF